MNRPLRKILFPIGEREVEVTGWRSLEVAAILARPGHTVDLMTYNKDIYEQAVERYKNCENINVLFTPADKPFWTMQLRDNFARTFIKLNHDLLLPDSDFHFWKLVAFDDFLWNVASNIFPKIAACYDLIFFPIPSFAEQPSSVCDVFYTNVLFYAKEHNVPVVGMQIHPVYNLPPNYKHFFDSVVVIDERTRRFFSNLGFAPEKIFHIDVLRDNYSISSIQDPYLDLAFKSEIVIDKDELGIVVLNSAKNRPQLYAIFRAIADLGIPYKLFFGFTGFAVRELHEKDIFEDLIQPELEKTVKKYYSVDSGGAVKALMLADVIVATEYLLPLSFAQTYNRTGIVFNALIDEVSEIPEVVFCSAVEQFRNTLLSCYQQKQTLMGLAEVVERI